MMGDKYTVAPTSYPIYVSVRLCAKMGEVSPPKKNKFMGVPAS